MEQRGAGSGSGPGVTVSGGGRLAVGTLELFAVADALAVAAHDLRACLQRIDRVEEIPRSALVSAPRSLTRAEFELADARAALQHAAGLGDTLASALRVAADAYGAAEAVAHELGRRATAWLALGAGYTGALSLALGGPLVATFALGTLLPVAAGVTLGAGADYGPEVTLIALRHLAWRRRAILSDPRLVSQVRHVVSGLDYAFAAAGGVPPPVIRFLDVRGSKGAALGGPGPDRTAAAISAAAGMAGALQEGPVRVQATSQGPATPATGYLDRAQRIPRGSDQVRIDRYVSTGHPDRFEVYIGGTADFSPVATTEPWDLTSNVAGLAGADPGAYRVVEQALADAGATAGSPLVVTGYSHGGTVAALLAASGDWDVRGVYTLGALAAAVPVPAGTPWVAVEHTDDVLPSLGGAWDNPAPIRVTREALAGGDGVPLSGRSDLMIPAHDLHRYRDTAAILDGAGEARVVAARRAFDEVSSGADRVESTWYHGARTAE